MDHALIGAIGLGVIIGIALTVLFVLWLGSLCDEQPAGDRKCKAIICAKPLFVVILREADQWTVEVEWPDGTIEQAIAVKSEFAARRWINQNSQSWIGDRTVPVRNLP